MDETIEACEGLGFDSIWVLERLFHRTPVLDAWTTLTWAAARTKRIQLGTSVLLGLLRNPALLAKEVATLDALSGGRFELGLSLGGTEDELAVTGIRYSERARRFEEAISIIRALLSGEAVNYEGRYYCVKDGTIAPSPQTPVPLWIGAVGERGMRRATRLADGWMPDGFLTGVCQTPDDFRELRERASEALVEDGRSVDGFRFGKLFYWAHISPDVSNSQRCVGEVASAYYGRDVDPERFLAGPGEMIAERLAGFVEAGLDTVILGPANADPEQISRLAEEVLPALRKIAPLATGG